MISDEQPERGAGVSTEESLADFLDLYLEAYFGRRDLNAIIACLSPSFSAFGTGMLELAADVEAAEAIYRRDISDVPNPVRYLFRSRQIRALAPHLGLILVELDIETEVQGKLLKMHHLRLTMTAAAPIAALTDKGMPVSAWRIEQMHISVPNSEQDAGEAYPVRELRERAALLENLTTELMRAEKRERTRIAGILHDHLQQLLVGARLGVEQAQRRLQRLGMPSDAGAPPGEALTRVVGLLRDAQQVMRDMVADLAPPILREAGLSAALHWLARVMRERYQQEVDVHIETDVSPQQAEVRDLLFDAVRECLFNAVKHAGCDRAEVRVGQQCPNRLQVSILDRGVGFDAERVLDVLQGGAGHGLIGLRERLALLGGRLQIDSQPGEGTRVSLSVPLDAAAFVPEFLRTASPIIPQQTRGCSVFIERRVRIVLVDDHSMVRGGLRALLADSPDLEVVGEASSGEEAIAEVARLQPDLVMMDASMPGMGGVEATRRICEQWPEVRVIGLSMYAEADCAAAMRSAGALDYLPKTGDVEALLEAIRRQFAGEPD